MEQIGVAARNARVGWQAVTIFDSTTLRTSQAKPSYLNDTASAKAHLGKGKKEVTAPTGVAGKAPPKKTKDDLMRDRMKIGR